MRILVTDSFCSSNRGDAAILHGMIDGLERRGAEVGVVSHFPAVTKHFHGIDAVDHRDPVAVARAIRRSDLVVSCGGSFLHDLYAKNLNPRLATMHLARRAEVPYAVFGQSIGPLVAPLSRTAAREVLDGAAWIGVRDPRSAEVVRDLGVSAPVHLGVDAAIGTLVGPADRGSAPLLGVTVRHWHFPGHAEGRQAAYERAVVEACRAWQRETHGVVRFFSNCTAFGGYAQDDRVVARRVAAQCDGEAVEEELGFMELRARLGACDFVVGTRMHSLIFATTACVPSFGIAYEFKTEEWMETVGQPGWVVDIADAGALPDRVMAAWHAREPAREELRARMPALRERAEEQLDRLVLVAAGERPSRARAGVGVSRGWNAETWRYDTAHRRLRAVADVVLAEGGERVLDLGCSSGMLGRMLGTAYDYEGVDIAASVATDRERFRIRTGALDTADFGAPRDVVVMSGSLEYVEDVPAVLCKARASLRPGGLAVVTLFNLAHVARGLGHAHRHRDWKFEARPDDLVLALHECGLRPVRVLASSAGWAPPAAVNDERPTDADLDGIGQMGPERLLRLAHHWIVVCRAAEAAPGPAMVAELAGEGRVLDALRLGVELARQYPWAARAWADLGVLWHTAGNPEKTVECLTRAALLDPGRPGVREDLGALGVAPASTDPETSLLLDPEDPMRWMVLEQALYEAGHLHGLRSVRALREARALAAK